MIYAVNGGLSNWGSWSECSATCGDGVITRTRTCTEPVPQFGGQGCDGSTSETIPCEQTLPECPGKLQS